MKVEAILLSSHVNRFNRHSYHVYGLVYLHVVMNVCILIIKLWSEWCQINVLILFICLDFILCK